jgi:hypothetical protein
MLDLDMDMDREEQHWRMEKDKKILGQKKHTSRGSKLMNLIVCIWYVHIHVLACIAYIFKFDMHACVVYASDRSWMMI